MKRGLKINAFVKLVKYIGTPCWPLLHRPLQRRPLLALFFKRSQSNFHRQTYNAGLFNAISRKITPFRAGVIRANKVRTALALT